MSIQGLEQLVLLPAGLLNSEPGAESFKKLCKLKGWTNSTEILPFHLESSIYFHLFMTDSIPGIACQNFIDCSANFIKTKPQVQQSHCRASVATTGETAWVCRSKWKSSWTRCETVRMTYPVELQVIHLAGMPNWVRVALGFSPVEINDWLQEWEIRPDPCQLVLTGFSELSIVQSMVWFSWVSWLRLPYA